MGKRANYLGINLILNEWINFRLAKKVRMHIYEVMRGFCFVSVQSHN